MELTPYQQELTKYNKAAAKKAADGGSPYLHKGKADVFRYFSKNGALTQASIINRLRKYHGIDTFQKQNRRNNFTEVCKWIVANVCLETRTFSSNGTQGQIAKSIGVNQATVSRIIALMIKMGVIRPAFTDSENPNVQNAGVVGDKDGIPLNNVYVVQDDFCLLAGPTAGAKLITAFQTADEKAEAKTGWTLKERLITVRNTLWEGTIERRIKQITEGCFKKVVAKATDRSRAVQIIMKRMIDRGEDRELTDSQFDRIVNYRLKSCGFSA